MRYSSAITKSINRIVMAYAMYSSRDKIERLHKNGRLVNDCKPFLSRKGEELPPRFFYENSSTVIEDDSFSFDWIALTAYWGFLADNDNPTWLNHQEIFGFDIDQLSKLFWADMSPTNRIGHITLAAIPPVFKSRNSDITKIEPFIEDILENKIRTWKIRATALNDGEEYTSELTIGCPALALESSLIEFSHHSESHSGMHIESFYIQDLNTEFSRREIDKIVKILGRVPRARLLFEEQQDQGQDCSS